MKVRQKEKKQRVEELKESSFTSCPHSHIPFEGRSACWANSLYRSALHQSTSQHPGKGKYDSSKRELNINIFILRRNLTFV